MKHSEALSAELLANCREKQLPLLACDHFLKFHTQYPPELNLALASGFSAMADNEDFQPQWEHFFPDDHSRSCFLQLEMTLVAPILERDPDKKKELRPLLDFFRTLERGR
eukprot:TRINITY_DN10414_c0_g1_i1.p3 TRINITY_DN10414_c0_g1~~TRINITY_DN10414_c0_g1_i1.p3  ORF type:complete len:110 (-),score=32.13 TRINITY_DN10414_c0_g1_i1:117-446(-)